MAEEATPTALPAATGKAVGGECQYLGFTVRETTKTTGATVVLYDNTNAASGPILEEIALNPGESRSENYPRPGRIAYNGIYAAITGAVEGSVFS